MKKRLVAFLLILALMASTVLLGACDNGDIENPASTGSSHGETTVPSTPISGDATTGTTAPSAPGGDVTTGTTAPSAPSGDVTTGTTAPTTPSSGDATTGTTAPTNPSSGDATTGTTAPTNPGNSTTPEPTEPSNGNEGGATEGSTPQGGNNEETKPQETTPTETQKPTEPSTVEHTHTDNDRNNVCDTCYVSVVVTIDFYALNDLHGKFCDTDKQPGVDNLATYLKTRKEYDDYVVLFSSGDMWQGAAESNLTNGLILTEWMNEMNFVSMTLGNHEYDWGEDAIRKNYAVAEFPFLAINIYDRSTGQRVDYCQPSVVVDCGEVQVGIIGAMGDCYSSISASMVSNVEFKTGSALTALVKAESERLRAQGVDLIIYSIHDGYDNSNYSAPTSISSSNLASYYDTALSNGYVDLVFEGHSHQRYVYYDNYQVYHVQGGGENKGLSHVELSLNFVTGQKTINQAEFVSNSVYSDYAEDPATEAIEDKYGDVINNANGVLGTISSKIYSDRLADIVAELYLQAGMERWGSQYNIVLAGGNLKTRSPYNLAAGEVTYSDLLSLLPFDNQLTLCSIRGSDLKKWFMSSRKDYHTYYSTYGNSVKNSISDNATYYILADTWTSAYEYTNITIIDYYDADVFARDLLAEAIRNGQIR